MIIFGIIKVYSHLSLSARIAFSLVKEAFNNTISKGERLLQVETFQDTFGPNSRRKRPNIGTSDMNEMLDKVVNNADEYDPTKDVDLHKNDMIDAKDEV